jgi:hypothetical protein
MLDYKTYQSLSDNKLLDLILSGDINASYYLICIKYQKELYRVIFNYFREVFIKFSNSSDLEYWLYKFWNYMDCPTKITEKNQFYNIKYRNNIHNWLCKCCKYFLLNYKMVEVFVPDAIKLKIDCSDDYNIIEDDKLKEFDSNVLKIKMADYFFIFLNIRDSYIMYSYLYCAKKGIYIVHLDEKIADTLTDCGYSDMSAEYVRKIKNKSIKKANNFFSKKYDNSGRHFLFSIDNSNMNIRDSRYEEILTERRNIIMLNLEIHSDFLMEM